MHLFLEKYILEFDKIEMTIRIFSENSTHTHTVKSS